nr:protein Jade-1-like [Aedes albopictus]
MSSRKSGKDGKSGSKGARSKEKPTETIDNSDGANVVVVVTGDKEDEEQVPEQDCTFCQESDNDEMVQCDKCDRWIHFACVGVTEEIADKSWSCPKCVTTTGFQLSPSSAAKRLPAGLPCRADQPKTAASKEQLIPRRTLATGKGVRCNTLSEPIGKTSPTHGDPHGATSRAKTVKSVASTSSRRSLLQLQLQRLEEEQEHEKQQAEKYRSYLDRKYELLEQMHSQTGSDCSASQSRMPGLQKPSTHRDTQHRTTPSKLKSVLLLRRISIAAVRIETQIMVGAAVLGENDRLDRYLQVGAS